jgi:hypothetical protein
MKDFSQYKSPITELKNYIAELQDSIPTIKVNHSEGNHGSDKGCCSWCGIVNPNNFMICEEQTAKAKLRTQKKVDGLKELFTLISKIRKEEQKILFRYLKF